jgi:hypothetical protein
MFEAFTYSLEHSQEWNISPGGDVMLWLQISNSLIPRHRDDRRGSLLATRRWALVAPLVLALSLLLAIGTAATKSPAQAASSSTAHVTVPLYRSWNPTITDHFYTADYGKHQNAIRNLGYTDEGIVGYLLSTQQQQPRNTVPLYRLWNPTITDHFYTTDSAERNNAIRNLGYANEGTVGYLYRINAQAPGTVPLYRLWNPTITDHFYTTDSAEGDNAVRNLGYTYEGAIGKLYR